MESWISYIYQSVDESLRGYGADVAPWLLLLILLIAGLLALREILLARKALRSRYDQHVANMMRFRGELARREALQSRPRLEHWL